MHTQSITPITYKAHIPTRLKESLFSEAFKKGSNITDSFLDQSAKFKTWGENTSSLVLIEQKGKDGIKKSLGLVNSYIAPFRQILLPQKESLLETFMALTKHDIVKAESKLLF